MRKEIAQNELEREQLKTSILEEQKLVLEKTVTERTHELQEANEQLHSQNKVVKQRENEKALLLQELNHRVKNNFQTISGLLSLQARSITDKEALRAIKESKSRIEALAMIHRELYNTHELTHLNMRGYTERLVQNLLTTSQIQSEIDLSIVVCDIPMPIQKAIPVGLILNELITNSLKHALPKVEKPHLLVSMSVKQEGVTELIVADNGPGLEKNIDRPVGFGLRLINALVKQLKGHMSHLAENGHAVSIRFETGEKK